MPLLELKTRVMYPAFGVVVTFLICLWQPTQLQPNCKREFLINTSAGDPKTEPSSDNPKFGLGNLDSKLETCVPRQVPKSPLPLSIGNCSTPPWITNTILGIRQHTNRTEPVVDKPVYPADSTHWWMPRPRKYIEFSIPYVVDRALQVPDSHRVSACNPPPEKVLPFVGTGANPQPSTVTFQEIFNNTAFAETKFIGRGFLNLSFDTLTPVFRAFPNKRARFAVVTAWHGTGFRTVEMGAATVFNKVHYCRRHGYDLYIDHPKELLEHSLAPTRHVQWAKPLAILKYIQFYEYVLWQDADIFNVNMNVSIENLMAQEVALRCLRLNVSPENCSRSNVNQVTEFYVGLETKFLFDVNTAQFIVHRSEFALKFLHDAWFMPYKGNNDQDALYHLIVKKFPGRHQQKNIDSLGLSLVYPLRKTGSWLLYWHCHSGRRYKYGDPFVHFTFCGYCSSAITHMFMVSIVLNDLQVPTHFAPLLDHMLFLPKSPPSFVPTTNQNSGFSILVAMLNTSEMRIQGKIPSRSNSSTVSWSQYCRHAGIAYDFAIKPDLVFEYFPQPLLQGELPILRQIESWLPYFQWVLFVSDDVYLNGNNVEWLTRVENYIKNLPQSVDVVIPSDDLDVSGSTAALLVRRSTFSFRFLEEVFYFDPKPHVIAATDRGANSKNGGKIGTTCTQAWLEDWFDNHQKRTISDAINGLRTQRLEHPSPEADGVYSLDIMRHFQRRNDFFRRLSHVNGVDDCVGMLQKCMQSKGSDCSQISSTNVTLLVACNS